MLFCAATTSGACAIARRIASGSESATCSAPVSDAVGVGARVGPCPTASAASGVSAAAWLVVQQTAAAMAAIEMEIRMITKDLHALTVDIRSSFPTEKGWLV